MLQETLTACRRPSDDVIWFAGPPLCETLVLLFLPSSATAADALIYRSKVIWEECKLTSHTATFLLESASGNRTGGKNTEWKQAWKTGLLLYTAGLQISAEWQPLNPMHGLFYIHFHSANLFKFSLWTRGNFGVKCHRTQANIIGTI